MRVRYFFIFLFFGLCFSFSAYGDLVQAEKFEKEGKPAAAYQEYTTWLKTHGTSSNYGTIAAKAAECAPTLTESITVLKEALPRLQKTQDRITLRTMLAEYAELSGNMESAQNYYEEAGSIASGKQRVLLLIQSAELLQYLGRYDESAIQLKSILKETVPNSPLYYKVYLALAKGNLVQGNMKSYEADVKVLEGVKGIPVVYYFLKDTEKGSGKLEHEFPLSPENLLASGQIHSIPTTETVFNLTNRKKLEKKIAAEKVHFYIQTGSFRDGENAEYMSRDLKKLGFAAFVEKQNIAGTLYYKVLLDAKSPEDVQKLILRLKDRGFEGYPIY